MAAPGNGDLTIYEFTPELAADLGKYKSTGSSPDANGNYTVVTFQRTDNTNVLVSTLSAQDTNGNYQTLTLKYYDLAGTTVIKTVTWSITYDTSSKIVTRTPAYS